MLSVPTRSFRVKAAIALTALYALCILAPSAAFALSSNPAMAHCLIEDHVAPVVHDHGNAHAHDHGGVMHQHADGTTHQHHDDGATPKHPDGKTPLPSCCGLFSVVAIADDPGAVLEPSSHASRLVPALRDALTGRGPDRINRPPIA
jgi:hypothetical protein